MQNSERQIAVVRNIIYRFTQTERWRESTIYGTPAYSRYTMVMNFDLYITDKRMVWVLRNSYRLNLRHSLISAIRKNHKTGRKQNEDDLVGIVTLDELLQRNKENFEVCYGDVQKIRLHGSRLSDLSRLFIETREIGKEFVLSKDQVEQLSSILPNIVALKDKLQLD